jgi:hypothetical protein
LKDSDVSVLEQEYGNQEHVQEDLKVLEKLIKWLKSKEVIDGTEVATAAHVN